MRKGIISGLAVLITVVLAALWLTSRSMTLQEATWEDVLAQAARGGYGVVSTDELWEWYQSEPDLLLVDTRQEWEYAAGHMAEAVVFPMEPTWWARWSKRSELQSLLGEDKERLIVFY